MVQVKTKMDTPPIDPDVKELGDALQAQLAARETAIGKLEDVAGFSPRFIYNQAQYLKTYEKLPAGAARNAALKAYSDKLEEAAKGRIDALLDSDSKKADAKALFAEGSIVSAANNAVKGIEDRQQTARDDKDLLATRKQVQEVNASIIKLDAEKARVGGEYGEPDSPTRKAFDALYDTRTDDAYKAYDAAKRVMDDRENEIRQLNASNDTEHAPDVAVDLIAARKAFIGAAGAYAKSVTSTLHDLDERAPAIPPGDARKVELDSGVKHLANIAGGNRALQA